ncbi:MAG: hypothetical protein V1790_19065 [Planctomycetota bacterium]
MEAPNQEPKKVLRQVPYALAMIICDQAYRDPATGKYTLLGTFSSIAAQKYSVTHPAMTVYIALTDGRGKTPMNSDSASRFFSRP